MESEEFTIDSPSAGTRSNGKHRIKERRGSRSMVRQHRNQSTAHFHRRSGALRIFLNIKSSQEETAPFKLDQAGIRIQPA